MKKSEFFERPDLATMEGDVLRISFNVTEEQVPVNTQEETPAGHVPETRTLYRAYVVRLKNPFTIERIKAALLAHEYEGELLSATAAEAIAAEALLTLVDAGILTGDRLAIAKTMKLAQLATYDSSDAVNQFTYQGVNMWLDKDMRNGLIARLNAEKAMGKTTSTLWYENMSFTLAIDDGLQMLAALEVYASECYDSTAAHKAEILAMEISDAVIAYDFTTGYPDKLVFK